MCNAETAAQLPKTLLEAVLYFADLDRCHSYMVGIKWPNGQVCCPACGNVDVGEIKSRRMFQCKARECRKQFSTKVGTIFEDSPLGYDKWLPAVWAIVNAKNGISSCELARAIGVTQKSAWHMLHRIRLAMQTKSFRKIGGVVEGDETRVGGKDKNRPLRERKRKVLAIRGEAFNVTRDKAVVQGLLERGGEVRAKVIPNTGHKAIQQTVRENVQARSYVFTDILPSYRGLHQDYVHEVVNHSVEYVRGRVHTNGIENFWTLLKRTIGGTYVQVTPEHLQRYLDEQCRRFNLRHLTDAGRFHAVIQRVIGRRLTYRQLISGA